jgi:hypothetical protein
LLGSKIYEFHIFSDISKFGNKFLLTISKLLGSKIYEFHIFSDFDYFYYFDFFTKFLTSIAFNGFELSHKNVHSVKILSTISDEFVHNEKSESEFEF